MQNYADRKLVEVYRQRQEEAMQDDWRVGAIMEFLEQKNPGELTCVREVCHRALSPDPDRPHEPSLVESKDIGMILNKLPDWERSSAKKVGKYGKQRCWRKLGITPVEPTHAPQNVTMSAWEADLWENE